jgi:hypothetical protein
MTSVRNFDLRLLAAALAIVTSGCASSDTWPDRTVRDDYSLSRPSNSSVMFPGEYSYGAPADALLWRLPQF